MVSDASQSDTIVGDNAHILTGIEQGIPANSYRYQTALLDAVSYLGDLKTIISDLEALVFAGHDSTLYVISSPKVQIRSQTLNPTLFTRFRLVMTRLMVDTTPI